MLMTALIIKHFITDFPLQTRFQYSNKGKFGHPGGILHALITILGTAIVLFLFKVPMDLQHHLLVVEFCAHYLTDWGKIRLNTVMDWGPTTSENFWILLGLDQLIHYLTYVWIVWMVTGGIV